MLLYAFSHKHCQGPIDSGAIESDLLTITEMADASWAELRLALEQAALLTVEPLDGVTVLFLHFHPVLTPYLQGLAGASDEALLARYAERYHAISRYYAQQDNRSPMQVRAVVRRDLPNLRRALVVLLETGQLESAVDMADNVGRFLNYFGLYPEQAQMQQRLTQALASQQSQDEDILTQTEFLYENSLGKEELRKGHLQAAITRFSRLLARIEAQSEGTTHGPGSFEHAQTLTSLGRCFGEGGDFSIAEQVDRKAIVIVEALVKQDPENRDSLGLQANLLADLGWMLREMGRYADAKAAHERSLQICEQIGNQRGLAVSQGQLGTIALYQEDSTEAQQRYQQAQATFQALGEPAMEAVTWHNLGVIAQKRRSWPEAERCYRESLTLREQLGDLVGAAQTCSHLGQVAEKTDRFEEAKGWCQRALILCEQTDTTSGDYAKHLFNLADLLVQEVEVGRVQDVSAQLVKAQRYVEQAQVIFERLRSPDLWNNYSLLAMIANLQGRVEAAQDYRRREREAYADIVGHRFPIEKLFGSYLPLFAVAQNNFEVRALVEELLSQWGEPDWFTEALQRIWAGERDWHTLVEGMNNECALLVLLVLEMLASPYDATLSYELNEPETSEETARE